MRQIKKLNEELRHMKVQEAASKRGEPERPVARPRHRSPGPERTPQPQYDRTRHVSPGRGGNKSSPWKLKDLTQLKTFIPKCVTRKKVREIVASFDRKSKVATEGNGRFVGVKRTQSSVSINSSRPKSSPRDDTDSLTKSWSPIKSVSWSLGDLTRTDDGSISTEDESSGLSSDYSVISHDEQRSDAGCQTGCDICDVKGLIGKFSEL